MSHADNEPLRARYQPPEIRVLFVGESAPAGGNFFYRQTGQVHREFRKALAPVIGAAPSFVDAFKRAGFYLDDLVLEPVNWLSPSERKDMHAASIVSLAERMKTHDAPRVVAFMKGIAAPVRTAIALSGKPRTLHVVPFPGNGRQGEFHAAMTTIIPRLLA